MKEVFLNGAGVISPQKSFTEEIFNEGFALDSGTRKKCVEPDYSQLIDPKQIRRMSRIIRMSVSCSITALKAAEISAPESIIVGTAFGCLEDTHAFLSRMVQYEEDMLSPTAFIHSTHNTIAAQVALHYKCYGYNSTYVHRSVSFESALSDAKMMLEAEEVNNVLVGGADEIIEASYTIMNRMGYFKSNENVSSTELFAADTKGSIAGEGSAFFLLENKSSKNSIAKVKFVESWSHVSINDVISNINSLFEKFQVSSNDIILGGFNGDVNEDKILTQIIESLSLKLNTFNFKRFCGEYGTASSFATWLGGNMLKRQVFPGLTGFEKNRNDNFKKVVIINQTNNIHFSVIILEAC